MRYSYQVTAGVAACAVGVLTCSMLVSYLRARRGLRVCPGPRTSLTAMLNPWRWFVRRGCGYDLHGLRAEPCGAITCPECGRRLPSLAHGRSHAGRVRWALIAVLLVVAARPLLLHPVMRSGRWAERVPNWVAVVHFALLGNHGNARLHAEATSRFYAGTLTASQKRWLIPVLVADLKDDDIRWNAETADGMLQSIGLPAVPALEAALRSSDWQQRQYAAHLLRIIHEQSGWDAYRPGHDLLQATTDGLRSDILPLDPGGPGRPASYSYLFNASEGVSYLASVGGIARPYLRKAMRGDDEQARMLAAGVAGFAHLTDLLPQAAPILIEHLKDNKVDEDAKYAAAALLRFGPDVLPYLEPLVRSTDHQQRCGALLVAWDLLTEDDDEPLPAQLQNVLSTAFLNPARLGMPGGYTGGPIPQLPIGRGGPHVAAIPAPSGAP